jgi:pimeloyl-ACP methyl ester carboxylesterase
MFYDKNIVLFDLPGFGNEKLVSNSWGIPEYSKWVLDKIKNIQGDKIIIGHSFGDIDALLYLNQGKRKELVNKTATPEKNTYIQSVKKFAEDFKIKQLN